MSEAAQHSAAGAEGEEALPPQARLLGYIAILAALTREAADGGKNSGPADLVVILDNICDYATRMGDAAGDTADVLGCGPETVEAVRLGKGRIDAFRACQGMGGSA